VTLIEGDVTDFDLDRMAMVSAFHRSPLGGYDQANILRSMRQAQPGITNKALAEDMQIDPSMPTMLLSLFGCIPEVQEAAQAGEIGVTHWYAISRSPDQLSALRDALNGASRDTLERENRRRRNGSGKAATVTASSIPLMLSSGIAITFKREGITLAMALDALTEVRKELDDAIKRDHDAKTFAALMKKRAKQMARELAKGA
jgi:hypothetical protein